MSEVGDYTITVPLASPELRRALAQVAQAFSDAEAAIGPSSGTTRGPATNRPGSRPPSGSPAAVRLCRRLEVDADRSTLSGAIVSAVERLYRETDSEARAARAEFRATVKAAQIRDRDETVSRLRQVYGARSSAV